MHSDSTTMDSNRRHNRPLFEEGIYNRYMPIPKKGRTEDSSTVLIRCFFCAIAVLTLFLSSLLSVDLLLCS